MRQAAPCPPSGQTLNVSGSEWLIVHVAAGPRQLEGRAACVITMVVLGLDEAVADGITNQVRRGAQIQFMANLFPVALHGL